MFHLNRHAWQALRAINAEFVSDTQSVACFDLRLVREVAELIAEHKTLSAQLCIAPVED